MKSFRHVIVAIRRELVDWRLWFGRGVLLAFAALAGLTVVSFTWVAEYALAQFFTFEKLYRWAPLIWVPASTAGIVWLTRRYVPGVAGSGIQQVIAAMTSEVAPHQRGLFVSMRLTIAKIALTTWGLLAGLSLGREGPSVQIAAGVMHHALRWLPARSRISGHDLLMAGGAVGIAAAFNAPLAGVMFGIEELSRRPEQRSSGLLMAAIVLGGLMAVSVYGNATHFGVIRVQSFGVDLLLPGLFVAFSSGIIGGLFSRLLVLSLTGKSADRFSLFRQRAPVRFAAACGMAVAILGVVSHGETYGGGYEHTLRVLEGRSESASLYVWLKFLATWITAWSGVPGGIFAPSLAIGAALGNDIAQLMSYVSAPTLVALGMVGFLAAVTQAPLTAFIIVMEMVDGHALVLSLMAASMVASAVSRLISAPLYQSLAEFQLQRLPKPSDQESGSK